MIKAKIYRSSKRVFECQIEGTKELVSATALREVVKRSHPVVGDYVHLNKNNDEYEITEALERSNSIFRRIVRTNKTKHIAANVDLILITASVSKPDYKPFLIDRYLLRATQWEIPVIVIFNKMDEFDNQFDLEYEKKKLHSLGVTTFEVSSKFKENETLNKNMDELIALLQGKTAICLGQSGVGKSKLISALSKGEIELLSSRLSKKVDKGAHTTTWAQVVDCNGFEMIDSPGIRSLAIQDISTDELDHLFPDLNIHFHKCKFNNCTHEDHIKGCYFNTLDMDLLENQIIMDRLISYMKIKDEVESVPEWDKD
ncbi:MAG: ribosome small subunit-dependent GTPase A [Bacteriovoracaceae bacterium]|jgi:ribosome biogenesis GTPase|nr:ribosome small subunit-dependent GTPase A [Bacteriovoracaceae bacterium]